MASSSSPTPAKKKEQSTADVIIFNPTITGAAAHGEVNVTVCPEKAPWAQQASARGCSWKNPFFPALPAAMRRAHGAASGQGVTPSWPAAASQLLQQHGPGDIRQEPLKGEAYLKGSKALE